MRWVTRAEREKSESARIFREQQTWFRQKAQKLERGGGGEKRAGFSILEGYAD